MTDLKNQVAVITGASSGIGKAIAMGLAEKGAILCLVGRKLKTLEAIAEKVRSKVSRVLYYQVDLTLDKDIQELIAYIERECGYVNLLIHSAGIISIGRLESAPVEDFDRQYRTNVRAPYLLTQALLPMLKLRGGQIVFINSSAGVRACANVSQYSATKFALKAIADSLREEVNDEGVRVLSVYPGRTATSMQSTVYKMEGREYHPEALMQPSDIASVVVNALSMPGSAEVTEIFLRPMNKTK